MKWQRYVLQIRTRVLQQFSTSVKTPGLLISMALYVLLIFAPRCDEHARSLRYEFGWGCQSAGDLAYQAVSRILISCFFSKSESNAALGGILNGSCPETDPLYR